MFYGFVMLCLKWWEIKIYMYMQYLQIFSCISHVILSCFIIIIVCSHGPNLYFDPSQSYTQALTCIWACAKSYKIHIGMTCTEFVPWLFNSSKSLTDPCGIPTQVKYHQPQLRKNYGKMYTIGNRSSDTFLFLL